MQKQQVKEDFKKTALIISILENFDQQAYLFSNSILLIKIQNIKI